MNVFFHFLSFAILLIAANNVHVRFEKKKYCKLANQRACHISFEPNFSTAKPKVLGQG